MSNDLAQINTLMAAVVQLPDSEDASKALHEAGIYVTQLASTGGFLGRGNATLLIGINNKQIETVVTILSVTCRRRVEYIATPLEGSPFHLPLPTPVTVGGATVFTLAVERFEELP